MSSANLHKIRFAQSDRNSLFSNESISQFSCRVGWTQKRRDPFQLPFESVDVRHPDAFKKRDDQQRKVSAVIVKKHKYVASGSVRERHRNSATSQTNPSGQNLFGQIGEHLQIDDGRDDAFQRAKLRVDSQREQHQEEQHGPELSAGELVYCFCKYYESQSRAGGRLKQKRTIIASGR
jgi:hypothetical protein